MPILLFAIGCTSSEPAAESAEPVTPAPEFDDTGALPSEWEVLAEMPGGGSWPAADVLDGRIHMVPSNTTDHFIYDPATDVWEAAASPPVQAHYRAGVSADGLFYLFGGGNPGAIDAIGDTLVYAPSTDSWSALAPMPLPRGYLVARAVGERIFTMGGPRYADETIHRTNEAYDPAGDSWEVMGLLPETTAWALYMGTAVAGTRIYAFGGGIYTLPDAFAYTYAPESDVWTGLSELPTASHGLAAAALGEQVYIIGGYHDHQDQVETLVYDIGADSYSDGPPLPGGRSYAVALTIGECIYVLGGNGAAVEHSLIRTCPESR